MGRGLDPWVVRARGGLGGIALGSVLGVLEEAAVVLAVEVAGGVRVVPREGALHRVRGEVTVPSGSLILPRA